MTFPNIRAGQKIRASLLQGMQIQHTRQGTDLINNSTAVVDSNLVIDAEANATYWYWLRIGYRTDTPVKFEWDNTTGGQMDRFGYGVASNATGSLDSQSAVVFRTYNERTAFEIAAPGGGTLAYLEDGILETASAGEVRLQFAQQVLAASDSVVRDVSTLVYVRID